MSTPGAMRRHRFPRSSALLVALATVVALALVAATVTTVFAYVRLDGAIERVERTATMAERELEAAGVELERVRASRREAITVLCQEDERLKAAIRGVLRRFDLEAEAAAFGPTDCSRRAEELLGR
jgi:predicted methyltransferase MtxX (methanogen marker protein 4)